jgi:hypothetical protein
MTSEEFKELKEGYLELVIKMITESGGLTPSFTILGTHKPDGKNAICLVPIENKFMKDEQSKDYFIDIVVPEIAEKTRELIEIRAIGWASEAWMRVADKTTTDVDKLKKDWKSLPIKAEVLIISIDSEEFKETSIKEIVRKGKQVNEDGELVDHIELVDMSEYSGEPMHAATGRFTDLYKKFTQKA